VTPPSAIASSRPTPVSPAPLESAPPHL
jgi:hypothetical protein